MKQRSDWRRLGAKKYWVRTIPGCNELRVKTLTTPIRLFYAHVNLARPQHVLRKFRWKSLQKHEKILPLLFQKIPRCVFAHHSARNLNLNFFEELEIVNFRDLDCFLAVPGAVIRTRLFCGVFSFPNIRRRHVVCPVYAPPIGSMGPEE